MNISSQHIKVCISKSGTTYGGPVAATSKARLDTNFKGKVSAFSTSHHKASSKPNVSASNLSTHHRRHMRVKRQQLQPESASQKTQSTIGSNNSLPAAFGSGNHVSSCEQVPGLSQSYCAASTPSPFAVSGSSEAAAAVAKACITKQRS